MNSKENYKDRLPTQAEIKESLQRYFGPMHSTINILGQLEYWIIREMKDKGWNIESSKNKIEVLIDDFVNIYGYIYKEGKSYRQHFFRGTNENEIYQMRTKGKEVPKILSVTNEKEIATRFAVGNKPAILEISLDEGLPAIYVEDFREDGENESEFLILPYSIVKYKDGYVRLGKGELPEIEYSEVQSLKKYCIDNYEKFLNDAKQNDALYYKIQGLLKRNQNEEGVKEDIEKSKEEDERLSKFVSEYEKNFQKMLKGLCKQREKDIDLEREEQKKRQKEERDRKEAARIAYLKEKIEEFKQDLSKSSVIIQDDTKSNIKRFTECIKKYRQYAKRLGIRTFNSSPNLEDEVQNRVEQIIEELQSEGETKKSEQNPDIEYGSLEDMAKNYEEAKELLKEMPELLEQYNQNSMADLVNNLNKKIQEIIYSVEFTKLDSQKREISLQKENIFSKLLGKTALKQAKLDNINARMEFARRKKGISSSENIEEILSKMHKCAKDFNDGNLTTDMIEIEKAIRQVFPDISEYFDEPEQLPATTNKKGIMSWIQNRQEVRRLNEDTFAINEDINNMEVSKRQEPNINTDLTTIYVRYNDILENVQKLVVREDEEQDIQSEKQGETQVK